MCIHGQRVLVASSSNRISKLGVLVSTRVLASYRVILSKRVLDEAIWLYRNLLLRNKYIFFNIVLLKSKAHKKHTIHQELKKEKQYIII